MYRRTCLALAVASGSQLAGCSFLGNGSSGNGDRGNGPDDVESEQTGFGPGSPTDEDLVRGHVGAAQAHLQSAVDELVSRGNSYGSLDETGQGPPVVARLDSLSVDPVRDELSKVEDNTERVREIDVESDSAIPWDPIEIAAEIEDVTAWLYAVLDAYPPLHELYLEAHYLVRDFETAGTEANVGTVRTAVSEAAAPVDDVVEAADRIDRLPPSDEDPPPIESIDAVTSDGVRFQTDKIEHELSAGRAVADAVEGMLAGDEIFWPARSAYPGAEGEPPEVGIFEDADAEYSEGTSPTLSPASMRFATSFCDCYARQLDFAARMYSTANEYYKFGAPSDESASEYVERAESAIEEARGCSFDWSGPDSSDGSQDSADSRP